MLLGSSGCRRRRCRRCQAESNLAVVCRSPSNCRWKTRDMTTGSAKDQALQAAYDIALWQLTKQMRSIEAFGTKAGGALTASLAFAGLFGAGVALAIDLKQQASLVAAVIVCWFSGVSCSPCSRSGGPRNRSGARFPCRALDRGRGRALRDACPPVVGGAFRDLMLSERRRARANSDVVLADAVGCCHQGVHTTGGLVAIAVAAALS
jgi:hypothetical protein